jgi:hypothetical protein
VTRTGKYGEASAIRLKKISTSPCEPISRDDARIGIETDAMTSRIVRALRSLGFEVAFPRRETRAA